MCKDNKEIFKIFFDLSLPHLEKKKRQKYTRKQIKWPKHFKKFINFFYYS